MVLNLKQIYEIVGEKLDVDYQISPESLDYVKGYTFSAPISVSAEVVNRAGIVTLTYFVKVLLKAECDRCLSEFEREYAFSFEHILVRSLNSEDNDEYVVTEDDKLELDELAVSDIILSLPSKMLCKEDCKGLCCHCGTNLNDHECNCNG